MYTISPFYSTLYLSVSCSRHIVCFMSDHWENFQHTFLDLALVSRSRLQLEYDMLFQRAALEILSAQRLVGVTGVFTFTSTVYQSSTHSHKPH